MEIPLLKDILIIFALAIAVLLVCLRLRVPSIVGFLLTGLLAGPHMLGFVSDVHNVEALAEIGVILLLFTIGIEFSLEQFVEMKRSVLLGGGLQVAVTFLAVVAAVTLFGKSGTEGIFLGFLVSLSSTAIVLKVLQERNEIGSPHGRVALAILIFQDVAAVPMMLLIPFLAAGSGPAGKAFLVLAAKGIGILLLIAVGAKWVVPKVLYQVARARSRELFLLAVLVLCFAVAWFTQKLGLSLALGAFLAGLIISATDYGHHALGNVLPFRDLFTSLFFVSIGMLLDLGFLFREPVRVAAVAGGTIVVKSLFAAGTVVLLGFPLRTALLAGLALSQIGEFSFILAGMGVALALVGEKTYQLFLAVSVVTMGATPFIIALAARIAEFALRLPLPAKVRTGFLFRSEPEAISPSQELRGHLIIVGYGLNGRNLVQAAKRAAIPYVIIEMNPETVRKEKRAGEPISYGDASQDAVLYHVGIGNARVMVVAISDPAATRRITAAARSLNPTLHIIARTRFFQEMEPLHELGADEVIPEEFETSVEIFTRVLNRYFLPRDEIDRFTAEARAGGYQMFRNPAHEAAPVCSLELQLPNVQVTAKRVGATSPLVGRSLAATELRPRYGISLLAIRREGEILANPGGEAIILANDILIILGSPASLAGAADLF
jgi:CPA2 family monovalent cation:H+ antiporter-2